MPKIELGWQRIKRKELFWAFVFGGAKIVINIPKDKK